MTERIQVSFKEEMMRWSTSLELAIGVTKPIKCFQRTMMPPEKPLDGIATQSQQRLNLLQKA